MADEGCAHYGTLQDLLKSSAGAGVSGGGGAGGGDAIVSDELLHRLNSVDGPRLLLDAKASALRVGSNNVTKVSEPYTRTPYPYPYPTSNAPLSLPLPHPY